MGGLAGLGNCRGLSYSLCADGSYGLWLLSLLRKIVPLCSALNLPLPIPSRFGLVFVGRTRGRPSSTSCLLAFTFKLATLAYEYRKFIFSHICLHAKPTFLLASAKISMILLYLIMDKSWWVLLCTMVLLVKFCRWRFPRIWFLLCPWSLGGLGVLARDLMWDIVYGCSMDHAWCIKLMWRLVL